MPLNAPPRNTIGGEVDIDGIIDRLLEGGEIGRFDGRGNPHILPKSKGDIISQPILLELEAP